MRWHRRLRRRLLKIVRRTVVVTLISTSTALVASLGWSSARAQQPPSPTTEPATTPAPESDTCAKVNAVENGGSVTRTQLPYQGRAQVVGGEGCAASNGRVQVYGSPGRVLLAGFDAFEDGSYRSPVFTLPADMRPGDQRLIVVAEGRPEIARPIVIAGAPGAPTAAPSPRQNVSGAVRASEVRFPRTPAGIAFLVVWGLALLILGSLVAIHGWRWVRQLGPFRNVRSKRRRRPLPLPAPEIPFVDTSEFFSAGSEEPAQPAEPPDPPTSRRSDTSG